MLCFVVELLETKDRKKKRLTLVGASLVDLPLHSKFLIMPLLTVQCRPCGPRVGGSSLI